MIPEPEKATLEQVIEFCLAMSSPDQAKQAEGHYAKLDANTVLYLPQGWLTCERSVDGALIYGCRKSFILNTPLAAQAYKNTIALLSRSNRNVERMEAISKLFTA